MDKQLKLAIDLATVLIVHNGLYPTRININEVVNRVVKSGLVPDIAAKADEVADVIAERYPEQTERLGKSLVYR